jgi:phosphoribosyl-ATP pyrophosphohydrolase/phosphoribosyl-AMP cyclohydrolase
VDDSQVAYDERGLVPCIVQDARSGEVLTLAYMNADALRLTRETGEMHFFSRSRHELWHKGATSGNTQALRAIRYDCDGDAVVALVDPAGPACHTGQRTCFHRGELDPPMPYETLPALARTIAERVRERPAGSYTVTLLDDPALARTIAERVRERPAGSYTVTLLDDAALAGAKVQEEAEEVARAAREESDERLSEEAADVLYHLLVLLAGRGLTLVDAERVLDGRRR